jgi:FlaA1/EpsC-like NDP-sugar epimerase
MPSTAQMLDRRVTVSQLRHVDPGDLLGRPAADLDEAGIMRLVTDSVIMVTGAGGSIGSELCRQIAAKKPRKLLLVERSEPALFAIHDELRRTLPDDAVEPLATDAGNADRMAAHFRRHRPSFVLHTAAHKHVPLMEAQPAEAFLNNVLATRVVARLAAECGASKFILISTDKAVNPGGVMGTTKRIAELLVREMQQESSGCVFAAVRFGNVLGSSGSVVPVFRKQIAEGGPLSVTHPEASRFFLSLSEAAGLILQSAWLARGGEVFLLRMGRPLRILDLANQMIELSGLVPGQDIEIVHTGLRPGEKLHEQATGEGEETRPTSHPMVVSVHGGPPPAATAEGVARLEQDLDRLAPEELRRRLLALAGI